MKVFRYGRWRRLLLSGAGLLLLAAFFAFWFRVPLLNFCWDQIASRKGWPVAMQAEAWGWNNLRWKEIAVAGDGWEIHLRDVSWLHGWSRVRRSDFGNVSVGSLRLGLDLAQEGQGFIWPDDLPFFEIGIELQEIQLHFWEAERNLVLEGNGQVSAGHHWQGSFFLEPAGGVVALVEIGLFLDPRALSGHASFSLKPGSLGSWYPVLSAWYPLAGLKEWLDPWMVEALNGVVEVSGGELTGAGMQISSLIHDSRIRIPELEFRYEACAGTTDEQSPAPGRVILFPAKVFWEDRAPAVLSAVVRIDADRWFWEAEARLPGTGAGLSAEGDLLVPDWIIPEIRVQVPSFEVERILQWLDDQSPLPRGWQASGQIALSATGAWDWATQVVPSGQMLFTWQEGFLHHPTWGISVEGIETRLELQEWWPPVSGPDQFFTFERAAIKGQVLERGEILAGLRGTNVQIDLARVFYLEGMFFVDPFEVNLLQPAFLTTTHVQGLSLGHLVGLWEGFPGYASGRLDGYLPIGWGSRRLQFGEGWLRLEPGTEASLRLTWPGLLTSGMSTRDPRYDTLVRAEKSLEMIRLDELEIHFFSSLEPERPVRIALRGATAGRDLLVPIVLQVNLNGSIDDIVSHLFP